MENEIYWLWLQGVLGYGRKVDELLSFFGTAENIYNADPKDMKDANIKSIGPKIIGQMKDTDAETFRDTLNFCREHKIHIITPESEFYPRRLRETENFPLVLYVRGDYTCLAGEKMIAVIGSRTPSKYGEEAAGEIVKGLCDNSYLIVSGGALGIDTIAHRSAIESGGKTVLVMGCGHGTKYLPENSALRKSVASHGALITEYPPFTKVTQATFPQRNRIISGMSEGVVIAEAAQLSGTFSTARHAIRQGRKVFVLPGDIKSGNFEGSNQLIVEGATPVFSAEDVLSSGKRRTSFTEKSGEPFEGILSEASSYKRKKSRKTTSKKDVKDSTEIKEEKNIGKTQKINMETISKNAGIVYNIMSDGANDFDSIVLGSDLQVRNVLTALTELELKGIISKVGSNQYRLNQ